MAPRGDHTADARIVVAAAIVHTGSGRVLALQRIDRGAWELPGGPVAPGEDPLRRLRAYVRTSTGFEVRDLTTTGRRTTSDGVLQFVRCQISGVGADITSGTRWLRWMDRAAIAEHMDPQTAAGMLQALDVAVDLTPASAAEDTPTLLAS